MKLYRFESNTEGINGGMFGRASQPGYRYFAPSLEASFMWGLWFNIFSESNEIEFYVAEYEVVGECYERYINSLTKKEYYKEYKTKEADIKFIRRTSFVMSIEEREVTTPEGNAIDIPFFKEEYDVPAREWKKVILE